MSNILKLGTAVVSLIGLSVVTVHLNQQAYRAGKNLWRDVTDSVDDIKNNGPDFSGVPGMFNLPDLEPRNETH